MAENSELEDEEGVMGRAIKSIDDLSFAKLKKQADRRRRKKFLEEQQLTGFARKSALWFDGLVSSDTFNQFIIAMILLTGSLAGVATYSSMQEGTASTVLTHVDDVILYIFTAEIAVKMLALGKQPQAYFWDPWNVFDFFIVVMCYPWLSLGLNLSFMRIIRLLRVLKLLNALPDLQILVVCLIKSFKSMIYILLLLVLLFYLYGVMACFVFQDNDPQHFGTLEIAFLSLYRISTFEDWTDIMYINVYGCNEYGYRSYPLRYDGTLNGPEFNCDPEKAYDFGAIGALYFVSFTVFATFIVFNLFVGVILTNIESARDDTIRSIRSAAGVLDPQVLVDEKNYRTARDGVAKIVVRSGEALATLEKIHWCEKFIKEARKKKKIRLGETMGAPINSGPFVATP